MESYWDVEDREKEGFEDNYSMKNPGDYCSDYKILNKTGCYYNEFLFLVKLFFASYSYSLKNKLLFYFYASIQAKLFISIIQQKNIQSCLEERVKGKPKKK